MSVDTPQKRSSCFEVPGLMMNPYPNGLNTAPDRVQMSDIYAGIAVAMPFVRPSETCWADAQRNDSSWKNAQRNGSTWKPAQRNGSAWKTAVHASSAWKKAGGNTSIWTKEEEVEQCQD